MLEHAEQVAAHESARTTKIWIARKLLRNVLEDAGGPRLVYVDHVTGHGVELFEQVRAIRAEGIVSKRRGSRYRGGPSRDWLKTKRHAAGRFVITGFQELGPGRLEAVHVAEETEGGLAPAGQVRFRRQGAMGVARSAPGWPRGPRWHNPDRARARRCAEVFRPAQGRRAPRWRTAVD